MGLAERVNYTGVSLCYRSNPVVLLCVAFKKGYRFSYIMLIAVPGEQQALAFPGVLGSQTGGALGFPSGPCG